jgi:hypothetical protein
MSMVPNLGEAIINFGLSSDESKEKEFISIVVEVFNKLYETQFYRKDWRLFESFLHQIILTTTVLNCR